MKGVHHDIHMEDRDAQLSTPAQRSDSDLNVSSLPRSVFQVKDRKPQPPAAKQQRVHSDAT